MSKEKVAAKSHGKPKKICPVSRENFKANAKPLSVSIGGQGMVAGPREFTTGSLGYYANGKTVIDIGGVPVECQVGISITAIGSKELPK